jgi:hypothetical protein
MARWYITASLKRQPVSQRGVAENGENSLETTMHGRGYND